MKCQNCGIKNANVKYKENINGKKQTLYLCEECAKSIGVSDMLDFSDFFSPMFVTKSNDRLIGRKKCGHCDESLEEYLNTGFLGCENCYDAFSENVDELSYKINGKNRHVRIKENNKVIEDKDEKITRLKKELEKLVKEEKYEIAAIIRDEIKKLEEE